MTFASKSPRPSGPAGRPAVAGRPNAAGPAASPAADAVPAPGPTARSAPLHSPPSSRARRRRGTWGWAGTPYLFLAVPILLLVLFTYIPVGNMFWYSLTSWDGLDKTKEFVGIDNYVAVFTRPELFKVFFVSLYYLGGSFVQMVLALYFATILSFSTRFRNVFKGILFFPYLINGVAIGLIFTYFFKAGGTLDTILHLVNADALIQQWTGNPDIVNFSLAGASVWRYMGLNFVLFLGAIQSIPGQIYEAAELDGANRWHQFRYIIAPSIKPIIGLSFILAVSGSLAVFEIPFIMTGGANGSMTFVIKTVDMAFQFSKVGLASAMAVVLLAIVLLLTWLQRTIIPDEKVNLT
ncbi:carbohydrate ABC transporter membrane protein 1, CUT1 family [Sanguibacter gelidistatuariae]|uniref:Carbohydrate ABC transporter membrane protein 1, CUT1 family n=1 Tax=Sanguibacter gelidistatuariae TaxID=1814289 RepID=A0A1G6VJS5_9MICO|nr:sugar ABC transporter permease [Sanguibacter gelidistatuariae]SDD53808.1 carbohydrate ABC transporter membrane protein 1, CUT1 family [Sanguibacter gelidistatuariae]